jgi:hypothetical protein
MGSTVQNVHKRCEAFTRAGMLSVYIYIYN